MDTASKKTNAVATASHRAALEAWLYEWALGRTIRKVGGSGADGRAGAGRPAGGEEVSTRRSFVPVEGQVILLPPVTAAFAVGRPVYVLVLRRAKDAFLVAPFGRFATPATDGEWKTGLRARPLRVLSFWNARMVSGRALGSGWLTASLSRTRCERAILIHEQIASGGGRTMRDVGPPLRHPLDPRHEYLAEEAALFEEHLLELENPGKVAAVVYPGATPARLKAAEDRATYGKRGRRRDDPDRR
ncbi:MAG: hypothetical protein WCL44_02895 [bacterium]